MRIKLGIYVPMYGGWLRGVDEEEAQASYSYAAATARKAEELGFSSIWVADHLVNPLKGEHAGALEAWTTLTALATITRGELFHTTLCQGFRYPAVLAKMGATLDDVSNGRFRFSLGAGWFEREFRAYGVPWHDHDTRIARAREQIEIITRLWTQPTTTFHGRFFEIVDGVLDPKPVQQPHPPIWWGGESEPSRELVADLADGWLMRGSSVDDVQTKLQDMARRLEQRGRSDLQYALPGRVFMAETDTAAKTQLKRMVGDDVTLYETTLRRSFVGSPATIAERIHHLDELGVDYITFQISPAMRTLEAFEAHLLPLL